MNEPTVHVQAAIVTGDIVKYFADGNLESITIPAERAEMISAELTALREENVALRERLANNHAAMSIYQRDIAALRERVAALENAAKVAHVAMVAMGNDLNWDMKDFGYGPPYFFPVEFNSAMAELRELTAEGVTE